jgi:hypothetical protein
MPHGLTELDERSGDLELYLDGFRPRDSISQETVRAIGRGLIPPLLTALDELDLSVFVTAKLDYLAEVCRDAEGEMHLAKVNDPRFHPDANRRDTCVMLLTRKAQILGCIGARLIWCERSLAEEMECGQFWVSDPRSMWSERDRCLTNSILARSITSSFVVYCGSVYLHPSVRGGVTLAALCRLHLIWLVSHWRWSWLVGVLHEGLLQRHAFDIYGVECVEQGIWMSREGDDSIHRYQLAFNRRETAMQCWLRPEMADLRRPMGRPPRVVLPYEAPKEIRGNKARPIRSRSDKIVASSLEL